MKRTIITGETWYYSNIKSLVKSDLSARWAFDSCDIILDEGHIDGNEFSNLEITNCNIRLISEEEKASEFTVEEMFPQEDENKREPVIYPDDQVPILTDIETFEYECGSPCTPDGCHGHYTDIPISFLLDNVGFYVEGYWGGDYPAGKAHVEEAKSVIKRLELALEKARNSENSSG